MLIASTLLPFLATVWQQCCRFRQQCRTKFRPFDKVEKKSNMSNLFPKKATMSKQHSTLSKGRNVTIESFNTVAVCGNKVEFCFDKVERSFDYKRCLLLRHCCWCGRGLRQQCRSSMLSVLCMGSLDIRWSHLWTRPCMLGSSDASRRRRPSSCDLEDGEVEHFADSEQCSAENETQRPAEVTHQSQARVRLLRMNASVLQLGEKYLHDQPSTTHTGITKTVIGGCITVLNLV